MGRGGVCAWVRAGIVGDRVIWDLNREGSASLGEEHDSEGGSDGSGGEVGGEAGDDGAGVAVGARDAAPDGLREGGVTLNLFSALPEWVL